jgi:hypothetical protein
LAGGRLTSLDELIGGVPGMVVVAGIFATIYPKLMGRVLNLGEFDKETIPPIFGVRPWPVIAVFITSILEFFAVLEIVHVRG